MKIVITGGHFAPAHALINELRDKVDFVIIGRKHSFEGDSGLSFEYTVAQKEQIPFYHLQTGRLQRRISKHTIPSLIRLPKGLYQAYSILKSEKPDIVMSFGGYLALPVALAARMLSIPVVIHEQTQQAGLANKMIGKFADKVLVSFKSSIQYFPTDKVVLSGNPVRKEVFTIHKSIDIPGGEKIIYVTGGSAGSHAINTSIGESLPELLKNYVIIHQTGDSQEFNDFGELVSKKELLETSLQKRYYLTKFVYPDQIGWIFKHADLIISRSGINTVQEIMALKKMSLLIPLPHGQNNEQQLNAQLIKRIGLGEFIEQRDLSPETLIGKVDEMFEHKDRYQVDHLSEEYFVPDAIQRIINELESIYEKKAAEK